ncbi:L-aminoadipate-semialdehyde dehydrogenase-phosphopantetheinyl transferase-like [Saccostrea echinata]|uniref:L-aminoadipate-semialdehyde dehydrogenase-phosphopantetheinyl transferase-like n=1 Tax=Saccostrea echinata TaxID=191078 RepID=UPI002A815D0F|nr:L-aminoadipate-semialdehyde dehydrogenase-phosphopantetheinyl transferase-like [Saccostrea echinata]
MIKWAFNFRAWQPTRSEWMFCGQCIQNEERERIKRFVFKKDAKAAMAGRLLIHKAIADCLDIPYKEIKLGRTEKGKPYLVNKVQGSLSFNVSHNGDYAVLAASKSGIIGVDVMKYEVRTSVPQFFHTMRRQFTESEWSQIQKSTEEREQLKTFYRLWCLKESYVKALGVGIGFEVSRLDFTFNTEYLEENVVTTDTFLKVDGVHLSEWTFEEHTMDNHCIVVAHNQQNTTMSDCDKESGRKFEHFKVLQLNDLVQCASSLCDPDEEFWEQFDPKDEAPQIHRKTSS